MSRKEFIETGRETVDGNTFTYQQVSCSVQGCEEHKRINKEGPSRPAHVVYNMARRSGWTIDAKRGRHRCPDHTKTKTKEIAVTSKTTTPPPNRVMNKEDKRKIFRAIDEAYVDHKTGYAEPVTDHSIAADLGMPWGWIAKVREEDFGPAGPDPEVKVALENLLALRKKADAVGTDALKVAERAEALEKDAQDLANAIAAHFGIKT